MRILRAALLLLCAFPMSAAERYLPAVARAQGANGTFFRSDVRIVNPSSSTLVAELTFLASGADNRNASSVNVTINGRESKDLDDIVLNLFGVSSGTGAVRIKSPSELIVSSRTYTPSADPACPGTYGQFINSIDLAEAKTRGVLPQISNSAIPTDGFRTNLGFVNPTEQAATAQLTLRNGAGGTSVGTASVPVPPVSHVQQPLSALFGVASLTSTNLFVEINASPAVLAYASVIDNRSGDQIFIPAQADPGTPKQGLEIIAKQWEFVPSTIEVNAGELVTIRVRTIDVDHGISFSGVGPFTCTSEQGGQCPLTPGEEVTVTFTPTTKGTFAFFCTRFCGGSFDGTHGHDTMRGTLVVK